MAAINVSLSDSLREFVDAQVSARGLGTGSEYVRDLIRYDRDRVQLRKRILASAEAEFVEPMDGAYFDRLRTNVHDAAGGGPAA